jgi:hypothetical protein
MDNFIVSARKYRPATFKSVVGQNAITETLKSSIRSGKVAQAFLFVVREEWVKPLALVFLLKRLTVNTSLKILNLAMNANHAARSTNRHRSISTNWTPRPTIRLMIFANW